MPNNSYLRSTKRERELVNKFRADGWVAARTAGSHSPHDVWAWNRGRRIVDLIQVKTKRGGRRIRVSDTQITKDVTVVEHTYHWE